MKNMLIAGLLLISPLIMTIVDGLYAETFFAGVAPDLIAKADVLTKCTESEINMKNKAISISSLQRLVDQKNYFGLRDSLSHNKTAWDKATYLFYQALVKNAFLNPCKSNDAIKHLLRDHRMELSDTMMAKILQVKEDNHVKLFQYKQAGETAESLVRSYAHVLDGGQVADEENNINIWTPLANTPGQTTNIGGTSQIPISKDKAGLANIPVSVQGNEFSFIVDTGADLCVLRKGLAEKLKLRKIETSVSVKGSTGKENKTELMVADSIKIGKITVKNVVFLVMPDDKLSFPQINYEINGIIGFPVIQQLKELHFSKNGILTIPKVTQKRKLKNLALCGAKSLLKITAGKDTIYCLLDTGANASELYKKYYCEHDKDVEKNGAPDSLKYSALGETKTRKTYKLKEFPISVGGKTAILPSIDVYTEDLRPDRNMFYGSIGQDYIGLFDEMIINYESMYIEFN
ncbi:retropepsin-like domain-containing protein [candidate division TA06 bacterium]|nr:retropepsin-like domain-containing protein [candidate division TA06 bacterium]